MSRTEDQGLRFDFSHFPWVFSLQLAEPASPDKPLRVEARDISRTGLKFVSNQKFPLFDQVQIVLFEKETGNEVATLFGKVIRLEEVDTGVTEKTYGIAVEFISGSPILDKFIPEPANVPEEEGGDSEV